MGIRTFGFWGSALIIFFTTASAHAQQACVDLFAKQPSAEVATEETAEVGDQAPAQKLILLPRDSEALMGFELYRRQLMEARTPEEANNAIMLMVINANAMMELAANNIFKLKTQPLPENIQQALFESTQILLTVLESRLQVPMHLLEQALFVRIEKQIADIIKFNEEAEARIPVGFRKSSERETAVEEVVEKMAIGFNSKPADPNEVVEKQPMGFVWNRETAGPVEKQPIGFGRPNKNETVEEGPVEKQPIGFVHFKSERGQETPIYEIRFNMSTGEFDFQRPGFKMGF